MTYLPSDGMILVFSNQRRWKNRRGGAAVTLRLRGRDVPGIAGPVEDAATVAREVQTFLARKGASAARTIDVQLDPKREPTGTEIVERTRGHVVLYITPDRGS